MLIRIILFLSTFAAYLYTLSPSISVGDSGEFCACASILGIPHSPGYPLYCILGKVFVSAVPFGSIAFRVNLISAVFSALAVVIIYSLVLKLTKKNYSAALVTSILFAFSQAFWRSAIQSEVFALNSFFVALLLYLLYLALSENKYFLLAVFIFGLGMGNHHTLVFIVPVFLLVLWKIAGTLRLRGYAAMVLLFLLGFSIYAYLPIRASKNPAFNWGNPVNLENFIRVVSRKDYGSFSLTVGEKKKLDLPTFAKQIKRYAVNSSRQVTAAVFLLGLAGWLLFIKKEKYFGTANLIMYLGAGIGFIPAIPFFLSAGYAVDFCVRKSKYTLILFLCLAAFLFSNTLKTCNWRDYYLEYDYAKNVLKACKPGSVLFMDGGDDTFYGTGYLSFAEKYRQDVELHDRGGLVFNNIYGSDFRGLYREDKETRRRAVERKMLDTRPVYFSTFNKDIMPGIKLYPNGILYDTKQPAFDSWELYCLQRSAFATFDDYRSRGLAPVYVIMRSETEKNQLEWLDYARNRWPDVMWMNSNLLIEYITRAYKFLETGSHAEAEVFYKKALDIDKTDANALLGLGLIAERRNNDTLAKDYYEQAIKARPKMPDAYYNLGVVYWKQNNWEKVAECFRKVLEIDPNHQQAGRYLPQVMLRLNK